MKLPSYLKQLPSKADRGQFATACGTSFGYLQLIVGGHRTPSPILCVAIERRSNGEVTRKELRPDDYWLIWPELLPSDKPSFLAKQLFRHDVAAKSQSEKQSTHSGENS